MEVYPLPEVVCDGWRVHPLPEVVCDGGWCVMEVCTLYLRWYVMDLRWYVLSHGAMTW